MMIAARRPHGLCAPVLALMFLTAARTAPGQTLPTFTRDVAPILFEHCAGCHRPGRFAPFSVLTFEAARPWARAIREQVVSGKMPPWKPEPGYGDFVAPRRLTPEQIAVLERWVAAGAVEGNPADLPPTPPPSTGGWELGTPDLVVEMAEPFVLSGESADLFRSFAVPVPMSRPRYVEAIEFQPGNYRVVHHARILIDSTGKARQLDDLDPEPGYSGMLDDGSDFPDGHFLGWLPGTRPTPSPEGLSWQIKPGEALVFQLHLLPNGMPETVRARVGIHFADSAPTREAFVLRLGRQDLDIPPGVDNYVVEDEYVLPIDVDALSVYPHAHYLGKEILGYATLPSGARKWLVYINDWDFAWQDQYIYTEPVFLPKGTTLTARFTYDNSSANPRNPWYPPRRVTFGSGSRDEMADLPLQVVARRREELPVLVGEMGLRERQLHITGDLKRLERAPDDPVIHDRLGSLLTDEGRFEEAIEHLEAAVQLAPDFVLAHFHLSDVHFLKRDVEQAVAHLERALEVSPGFVPALHSLGKLRQAQGLLEEAVGLFRRALAVNADDAEAHNSLGGIFQRLGGLRQAVQHFDQAVRSRPDYALAHYNLGFTLVLDGRPLEGIESFEEAIAREPEWPVPLVELAWVLATSPDSSVRNADAAVRLAERAVALTDQSDVSALDALGAAYASSGRFEDALEAAETALEIAGPEADGIFSAVRQRRDLYRSGRPYRTTP